ncbi:MAG: pyruvate synthase subunit PorB [archaeon GB-1867-005]|nr:pyruvate synthase subunit PorB [Candidatus Culexmicrobium cathedralense]
MRITVKDLPVEEYLLAGNASCPGCPASLGLRMLGKALGGKLILVVPACCSTIIQGAFPKTAANFPVLNIAFAASAATASGVAAGLEVKGEKDVHVVVWAGDGGTADIGIQALSGAAERGDNIIYICYDNEAYMNTGIQRSGATPYGAWTTTTWTGKKEFKKDVPMIMAAHNLPYIATACVAYPLDFIAKVRKAAKYRGTKYIHLLAPCPPGWRFPSEKTVEVGRLAVLTGMWALYEIENGVFRLTGPSAALIDKARRKPIREYLKLQGRFAKMSDEDVEKLQEFVDMQWEHYKALLEESRRQGE